MENNVNTVIFNVMKVTLKEIAEKCGVSMMTVSRAVRDVPGIGEAKRVQIKKIAKEMGYIPHSGARQMITGKTMTIGVIVPDIENTIFPAVVKGIEEVISREGYRLFLCCSYENPVKEREEIDALLERRVDGMIWVPCSENESRENADKILSKDCPLVFLDRLIPDIKTDSVLVDDYSGAYQAVQHLIEEGFKRIAHICGNPNAWTAFERLRGYRDALKEHKLSYRKEYVIVSNLTVAGGTYAMNQLIRLKNRPDAVFCFNDPMAVGAYQALQKSRLNVPEDMGLIGFSGTIESELTGISTVFQDGNNLGRQSAKSLLRKIADPDILPCHHILKTHLLIRSSSRKGK